MTGRIVSYAVEQTGLWVKAASNDPKRWIGKDVEVCSEISTLSDMAKGPIPNQREKGRYRSRFRK